MERATSIQDIWLIEEKAINLRSFKTFKPPRAPTREDRRAINIIIDVRVESKVK